MRRSRSRSGSRESAAETFRSVLSFFQWMPRAAEGEENAPFFLPSEIYGREGSFKGIRSLAEDESDMERKG